MRNRKGQYKINGNPLFSSGLLFLDDCEGTCTWIMGGTGGDSTVSHETTAAFMGLKGLRLVTRTTTATTGDNVQARRYFPYAKAGPLYFKCLFMMPDTVRTNNMVFEFDIFNGTRCYTAGISYDPADGNLHYRNNAGVYTSIAGTVYLPVGDAWINMEIAIDTEKKQYIGVKCGHNEVSLVGTAFQNYAAGLYHTNKMTLTIQTASNNPLTVNFDNFYAGTSEHA